jgi:hypothetical protein
MDLEIRTQRKLNDAILAAGIVDLDRERRELADILIRNCRDDLLRWPSLADDIISDLATALEGLKSCTAES